MFSEIYRVFSAYVKGVVVSKYVSSFKMEFLNPNLFTAIHGNILQQNLYFNNTFNMYPAMSIMNNNSYLYFPICSICQFEFTSREEIMCFIEDLIWRELDLNSNIIRKQNRFRRKAELNNYAANDYPRNVRKSETIIEKRKVLIEKFKQKSLTSVECNSL